jgi:hypothetical protein
VTSDSPEKTSVALASVLNSVSVVEAPLQGTDGRSPSPVALHVSLTAGEQTSTQVVNIAPGVLGAPSDFDPERCIAVGMWRPYRALAEHMSNAEYELARSRRELNDAYVRVQLRPKRKKASKDRQCPTEMRAVSILVSATGVQETPDWNKGVIVTKGLNAPDNSLGDTPEEMLWELPVYETWQQVNTTTDDKGVQTLPVDPTDGTYEFYVHVAIQDSNGQWVARSPQKVWLQLETTPPRFEWWVVTHPGAFNVAYMKCTDLLGSGDGSPTALSTSSPLPRGRRSPRERTCCSAPMPRAPMACSTTWRPWSCWTVKGCSGVAERATKPANRQKSTRAVGSVCPSRSLGSGRTASRSPAGCGGPMTVRRETALKRTSGTAPSLSSRSSTATR